MQAVLDALPEGATKLQTASDQAEVIQPDTATSGQLAIKDQLQITAKQLEELQQHSQMAQANLQEGVNLQDQYEKTCGELLDWINQAEGEMKALEAPGENLEEKQAKLESLKVK